MRIEPSSVTSQYYLDKLPDNRIKASEVLKKADNEDIRKLPEIDERKSQFSGWGVIYEYSVYKATSYDEYLLKNEYLNELSPTAKPFLSALKGGEDVSLTGILENLSAKYMDMRDEIETNFQGEDRENRYKWLDEVFNIIVDSDISLDSYSKIKSAQDFDSAKANVNNRLLKEGYSVWGGIEVLPYMEIDMKARCQALNSIVPSIKNMAQSIKQYFLDGGKKAKTDEEKTELANYLLKSDSKAAQ